MDGGGPLRYLVNAEEIDIKIPRGQARGRGAPASKTTLLIAQVRGAHPHRPVSPHHDIYSVEDLAHHPTFGQVNPMAGRFGSSSPLAGVGPVSLVVAKAGPGSLHRVRDRRESGEQHFYVRDKTPGILKCELADRGLWPIDLAASGRIQTPRTSPRSSSWGQPDQHGHAPDARERLRQGGSCQNDDCPVGIATQQQDLVEKFPGRPENVIHSWPSWPSERSGYSTSTP